MKFSSKFHRIICWTQTSRRGINLQEGEAKLRSSFRDLFGGQEAPNLTRTHHLHLQAPTWPVESAAAAAAGAQG